jgi:hypothetical protein
MIPSLIARMDRRSERVLDRYREIKPTPLAATF